MDEIIPGVLHWTAEHPKIQMPVSSYWVPASGALIDPLLPPDRGMDAFRDRPHDRILLSNRHHLRDAQRIAEELGCTIKCSRPGLHEFEGGPEVEGFDFGDEVAPGIEALEVGAICPDESALLIRDAKALVIADGIIRYGADLQFVPDGLLGDDPEGVKRGLRESYSRLLDRDFDSLLFAHGDPLIGTGKEALREFAEIGDRTADVAAAGGVLLRRDEEGETRVAVIHRPKYMDWSLPKGKLEEGEGWMEAALREVEEETGYRCEPSVELPPIAYLDRKGRRKLVRYWVMEPLDGRFEPHAEVDELRWVTRDEADELLTYPHDQELVGKAIRRRRLPGLRRRK